MSCQKNNLSPYQNWLCRKALHCVFDTLDFDGDYAKNVVHESYLLNLGILRKYARDNHMDEMSFILDIRDVLLKSEKVHGV